MAGSVAARAPRHPQAALRCGVANALTLCAPPDEGRLRCDLVGVARDPNFRWEGAAFKSY